MACSQTELCSLLSYGAVILVINGLIAAGLMALAQQVKADNFTVVIIGFLIYSVILLLLNKVLNLNTEAEQAHSPCWETIFRRLYIQVSRYLFGRKFLRVMDGPLKVTSGLPPAATNTSWANTKIR